MSAHLTAADMAATTFPAQFTEDKALALGVAVQGKFHRIGIAARLALLVMTNDDKDLERLIAADTDGSFAAMLEAITEAGKEVRAIDEFLTAGGVRIATIFARLDPEGAANALDSDHSKAGDAGEVGGAE